MAKLNALDWLAMLLVIIGGLNWGFVGLFQFNLVDFLFGATIITKIVYTLVGLAALYMLVMAVKLGKK